MRLCANAVNVTTRADRLQCGKVKSFRSVEKIGDEPLQTAGCLEALRCAFALQQLKIRVFRSIAEALVGPVLESRHHLPLRGAVRTDFIADNPFGLYDCFSVAWSAAVLRL